MNVKKYMKFNILDGIIDVLNQKEKFRMKPHIQIQNTSNNTTIIQKEESYLTKIAELKKSSDFRGVYQLLDELSEKEDHEMITKACDERLWRKTNGLNKSNVLHVACDEGNLRLVKSLIDCGCDKEVKNNDGYTPLIIASSSGKLNVVKYLVSIGANKEARDNFGCTPFSVATGNVKKYLKSIGVK
ncbi:hypothetical protein TVAG_063440 [Trichomonas vaginalis G3]|uniref:Uncharacterized protein n=1 Tax=Trichomonas vaginalis (strain ATCC PRA-98 / G3) TaxID=412133 RepID=A2EU14_TRIV3|nr:ankyrin repeat protein family [Trichomonas vaginalis G3]EAY03831.1 hypothetical protein TVAG_063440 [Trichomonas vaginalis G3]KAI5487511.1 ankyrin repeat protein family [Trichomonas vaginalis G3]|eukprot:XP_001316054.1 hypothetical protein [Trichomonas vaginalis G3]